MIRYNVLFQRNQKRFFKVVKTKHKFKDLRVKRMNAAVTFTHS